MSNNAEQMQNTDEGESSENTSYSFDDTYDKAFADLQAAESGGDQEAEGYEDETSLSNDNEGGEDELIYGLPKAVYDERRAAGHMTLEEWQEKGGDPDLWRPWGAFKQHGEMISKVKQLEAENRKQQQLFEEKLRQVVEFQEKQQMKVAQTETQKLERDLKERARVAFEDGDFEAYQAVQDQMVKLKVQAELDQYETVEEGEEDSPASTDNEATQAQQQLYEEALDLEAKFTEENPWYATHQDLQDYVGTQVKVLYESNPDLGLAAAIQKAGEMARTNFKDHVAFRKTKRAASRFTDTSHRGNAKANKSSASWDALPEDAKQFYVSAGWSDTMDKNKFAEIFGQGTDK